MIAPILSFRARSEPGSATRSGIFVPRSRVQDADSAKESRAMALFSLDDVVSFRDVAVIRSTRSALVRPEIE